MNDSNPLAAASAVSAQNKIPVTVLTGYLGAEIGRAHV